MKCNKCGTVNNEGAKFCRSCGAELSSTSSNPVENVMEKFSNYHLEPTNLIEWEKPSFSMFIHKIARILIIADICFLLYCLFSLAFYNVRYSEYENSYSEVEYECYINDKTDMLFYGSSWYDNHSRSEAFKYAQGNYHWHIYPFIMLAVFLNVFFIPLSILSNLKGPNDKNPTLRSLADYIEKYSLPGLYRKKKKIYKFFVKDGKFGVMDVTHYNIQIPAGYDVLSWKEKNKFLIAEKDGRRFFIDINNVELK